MLSREEISIRLGIDSKAIKTGLASVGSQIKSFAKSTAGQLAAAFSFSAVIAQIKSTIDYVEQLSNTAGSLAVSTSFLQDVNNIGIAAGKSQEKMEKLLALFAKGLAPGQDLETEFMKFLDELNNTKDPTERLAKAFDRVGKSGKDLLDVARDGSAAFKELAKTFQKLSESDIAAINNLDQKLDYFWNKIKIGTGNAIGWIDDFRQVISDPRFSMGGEFEDIGLTAQLEMIRSERRIKEMQKRLENKKAKNASEQARITQEPGILQGPLQPDQDPRYGNRQFSFAQPRAASPMTGQAAVDDYMSKIKASQDTYKAKTDYSQFGKAIVQAQIEASNELVQKVAIVEIKE